MSRERENRLRRWLRLDRKPAGGIGVRLHRHTDRPYSSIEVLDEEGYDADYEAYQQEDWRADLAKRVAFLPQRSRHQVQQKWWQAQSALEQQLAHRALLSSRRLLFRTQHAQELGNCRAVEGWLQLGRYRLPLSVISSSAIAELAQNTWDSGEVMLDHNLLFSSRYNLIVPGDQLDELKIREAILRWYMDQVEWERGHWAVKEKTLPEVWLDLHWHTPEEMYPDLTPAEREALPHFMHEHNREFNHKQRARRWRKFGRPEPPAPSSKP